MFQQLPTELQLAILQILPQDDFRSLRLTSRTFGDTGKLVLNDRVVRRIKDGPGHRYYLSNYRQRRITIVDYCRNIHTLGDCFTPEVSSLLTSLRLHDYTGYLTQTPRARTPQPTEREYELLDSCLSRISLPALEWLHLEGLTSNKIQVLINLIDNHAKTLRGISIHDHRLRRRTCSMELFRTGVGLRYEWKPLFESISSIIDRPLKLRLLTLSGLTVEIPGPEQHRRWSRLTVDKHFRESHRLTQTPFLAAYGRVPKIKMTTAEDKELDVRTLGRKPKNLDIEGRHAVRQGLQMLITGDSSYLEI